MMKKNSFLFFSFLFFSFCASFAVFAAESRDDVKKLEKKERLSAVDEYSLSSITVIEEKPGDINIDRAALDALPDAGEGITGALRGNSSVQFDSLALDSFAGGAITPPRVSIRGSHHYENNFTINGMSNNNVMTPGGFDEGMNFNSNEVFGDSRAMFFSPDLFEKVVAHTENVSAEYGNFLGGVVDAKLRDAARDRWHVTLHARHTRDQWARQHYMAGNEPDDYPTSAKGQHPRFKKYTFGTIVEGPVADNMGLLVAYDRKWSTIPVYMKLKATSPEEHTSRRLNENYLLRFGSQTESLKSSLTAIYAPYTAKMYPPLQRNGKYEINGGGYGLNLELDWQTALGTWENMLAFSGAETSKKSNSAVSYQWLAYPGGAPSKYANWTDGTHPTKSKANEGMQGDLEKKQKVYELQSHFRVQDFETNIFQHKVFAGLDLKFLRAKAERSGYVAYSGPKKKPNVLGSRADGVIEKEQYCMTKMTFLPDSRSQGYNTVDFFLEDSVKFGRVFVRPGLRFSWDDITKDVNLAPRFFANVDMLNDKRFNLFGGYNRYYGSQILSRALRLPTRKITELRKVNGSNKLYVFKKKVTEKEYDKLGDMKTPYTNEYTVGASAFVLDTTFGVTFVDRRYKDQLRLHANYNGLKFVNYNYTNDGKSTYWGLTFKAEKRFDFDTFGIHKCKLAATRSGSKSNYAKWLDGFDENDSWNDSRYVKLNGQFVTKDKLPKGNFASPWVLTYSQEMLFVDGKLRLMPVLRYETGGETLLLLKSGGAAVDAPDGKKANVYETRGRRDVFNVNLSAALDVLDYNEHVLTVEMDVTNLLDRKNVIDVNPDKPSCSMGRQVYMGLKYTF